MKKIFILGLFAIFCLTACSQITENHNISENSVTQQAHNSQENKAAEEPQKTSPDATPRIANLEHLKKWEGKYPHEVNLFKEPAFAKRLAMLSASDVAFIEKLALEEPIRLKHEHLLHIFKADKGGVGEGKAVVVIDLKENVIYTAVSSGVAPIFRSENDIDSNDGSSFNIDAAPVEVMELLNEVN